jgi:N-acetylneuraminic acid mutarotase
MTRRLARAALPVVAVLLAGCAQRPPVVVSSPPVLAETVQRAGPLPAAPVAAQTPRWTPRAPLPERRTEVSVATDGRHLYLAGGFGPPEAAERATAPRTLWRYDPQADRWNALTEIPEGVHHTAFVYHEGRLYILGGFRETGFTPVGNVRIYHLASGQWSEGAPMPTPRGAMGFTVLNGRIHLLGGNAPGPHAVHDHEGARIGEDRSVNTHEAYDPATDSWQRLAPMPTPRNHLGAATVDGRIHAVVGRLERDFEMTTHEVYDPASDSWSAGPPVPTGRSGVAVLAHEGWVYVFGGETFTDPARTFAEAERFDPRSGRWEALPPMPSARHGLGAAVHGGAIYVVSGGPGPGFTFGDVNERLELPPAP